MRSARYILWGSTLAALVLTAFKSSFIWVAAPLLGAALSYSLLHLFLYRPPEDHLGVIYRLGRFSRWVGPDEWEVVIPGIDEIKCPISLHLRRMEINLSDLLTQDQVPVDCKLVAYYQLDLRHAGPHFRSQALRIPGEGWNSIIRTVLQETANEVIGGIALQELLTSEGRRLLKHTLSSKLAQRVQDLGLLISPRTGVSVQVLKPTDAVWRAMVDKFAAASLGEAALDRVRSILEELSRADPKLAWQALLLEWAAAVVQQGNLPQFVIASGDVLGRNGHTQSTLPSALQAALQDIAASAAERRLETTTVNRSQDNEQRAA